MKKMRKMSWSKKHNNCISCNTIEFGHKHKGFCTKCYPIRKKLDLLSKWNYKDKSSFKGIKQHSLLSISSYDSIKIQQTNTYIRNQYIIRLNQIIILSNLDLIDDELADVELEKSFSKISKMHGIKKDIFYGSSVIYSQYFEISQIKFLLKQFLMIEVSKALYIQEIHVGPYTQSLLSILSPKKTTL